MLPSLDTETSKIDRFPAPVLVSPPILHCRVVRPVMMPTE
jgi:hypothetical protein